MALMRAGETMDADTALMSMKKRLGSGAMLRTWSKLGLLSLIVLFWVVFALTAPGFASSYNQFNLLRLASVQITVAMSQMIMLTAREFNLSIGAIGAIAAVATGGMMQAFGAPPAVAAVVGVVAGTGLGLINGLLVVATGISSFVITLATASIFYGAMVIGTEAKGFTDLPLGFNSFSNTYLFGLPISPLVVIMLVVAIALILVYRNTTLGRRFLAIGANRRAAEMSGVQVNRALILLHICAAAVAAIAGVMTASMLGTAVPNIGLNWLLPSFAAPAIGGTLISGGVVSVTGTMMGGLLIGIITSGLLLLNLADLWLNVFIGVLLLTAIVLDRLRARAAERYVEE